MKRLVVLWKWLAQETGEWLCIDTAHDENTVMRRSNTEGLSFLTITLPSYGKDFDRALSDGRIDPTMFAGFRRSGGLPLFLGGFLGRVFDRQSGILLENPNLDAVFAVRQLTGVFAKILVPCSSQRTKDAFRKFIETEHALQDQHREWTQSDSLAFSRVSGILFDRILARGNDLIAKGILIPKHGPGATADRLIGNNKFNLKMWTERLERVFPSVDYLIPSASYYKMLRDVRYVSPEQELPVRVVPVPKTLKTPRLIAIEPTCMQYAQQAVSGCITELIEHDDIVQRFIAFRVQEHNQFLARVGSLDGSLATLDLSEASDRVSNQLVIRLLAGQPDLLEAVQSCRSLRAEVDGYGVIPLVKFASMGSALTFPIESMIFLTLVFIGIEKGLGRRLTIADVIKYTGKVRVYGDDLIVPVTDAVAVSETLEAFGFKVNDRKSYMKGNFRESCGKEYFRGTDVSIVKCRREFPLHSAGRTKWVRGRAMEKIQRIVSLVEFRNLLFERGFRSTTERLDVLVREVLPFWPDGHRDSPGLIRLVEDPFVKYDSWDRDLHVGKVRAYVPVYQYRKTVLDDTGALLKHFLKQGLEPFADRRHLERSGRPVAVKLKLRNVKAG